MCELVSMNQLTSFSFLDSGCSCQLHLCKELGSSTQVVNVVALSHQQMVQMTSQCLDILLGSPSHDTGCLLHVRGQKTDRLLCEARFTLYVLNDCDKPAQTVCTISSCLTLDARMASCMSVHFLFNPITSCMSHAASQVHHAQAPYHQAEMAWQHCFYEVRSVPGSHELQSKTAIAL